MIRLVLGIILGFVANAIGLIAASFFLEGFELNMTSFLIAILIFSVTSALLSPFLGKVALTRAPFLMGGISLVSTFIALLITTLFTNGISIQGIETWLIATLVVWLFSMLGNVILPFIIFKMILDKRRSSKSQPVTTQPEQ